jgi:alkylation response protein AidB-like acyl-CoA dehydrogenase
MEQVVYAEEMHRAGAPGTVNIIDLSNVAPALMEHGTEEQKRELLPRMLRGDDIWCRASPSPTPFRPGVAVDLGGARRGRHRRQRTEDLEHARCLRQPV